MEFLRKCISHVDSRTQALKFALDAVAVLKKLVGSLDDESDNSFAKGFLAPLVPELETVYVRLEKFASDGDCVPGSDAEMRIVKLLVVLENLVSWSSTTKPSPNPSDQPSSAFTPHNYDSLQSLVRESQNSEKSTTYLGNDSHTKTKDRVLELARSVKERAARDRSKFLTSLSAFSGKKSPKKGLPLSKVLEINAMECGEELKEGREKLRTSYDDCLRLLHTALHNCSPQVNECSGGFTTNIALGRVKRLEGNEEVIFFDCFFLHPHLSEPNSAGDGWKQAQLKVFLQSNSDHSSTVRKVHFDKTPGRVILSNELCSLIRHPVAGRLLLNITSNSLIHDDTELPEFDADEQREFSIFDPSVSLATILEKRKLQDASLRLLLSYLLAKAVWQFYESDWMKPCWTKDAIHFMRESLYGQEDSQDILTLLHKPYLTTKLWASPLSHAWHSEEPESSREICTTHSHPKILALGIMLLEIELGETIDQDLQKTLETYRRPIHNAEQLTAWKIAHNTRRFNTHAALEEIIKSCLQPNRGKFGKSMDESSVRDSLYTNVVAPLETLCKHAWHQTGEPESFDPEPIQFDPTELPPSIETLQVQPNPDSTRSMIRDSPQGKILCQSLSPQITSGHGANPGSSQPRAEVEPSISECGQLGADIDDGIISMRKKTDKWFSEFLKLQRSEFGRGPGIKVAVLDSGIDYAGFRLSDRDRIEETKTFVESNPEEDRTRHGTHVAAIILRLTERKNVKLYIGKVTESHVVHQREAIVKAIDFARTEWKVDIISLSFGFCNPQPLKQNGKLVDPMEQAIKACVDENIIVFASASNDGGEGSRTYPAMYSQVVCAHASDCWGNPCGSNPNPLERKDNFTFVGEKIRPVWSLESMDNDFQGIKYVSGTSYATPVAVSIAIFILGFIYEEMQPGKEMEHVKWRIQPKSPEGITEIFRIMAFKRKDFHWVSPTKYFNENGKGVIREQLKKGLAWSDNHKSDR